MKGIKDRFFTFFKNNYSYFASVLAIIALFLTAQAVFGIWPIGKAIMASYDNLAQICPTLEHLFSVFEGESGLFHTFYLGRGMDMFGTLSYCAISPFTFLFLIAGRTGSFYMVSIVVPLKACAIAVSGIWFAKKYFEAIPEYLKAVFGVLYALGGYFFFANTYTNWLDLLIYMPIVVSSFIKFTKGQGIKSLSISLALLIYACFSLSSFSFFLLFPIGVSYFLIVGGKGERLKSVAKLTVAFAVAVALSLPVLLPSLSAYLKAGRNTGLFGKIFTQEWNTAEPIYRKFSYIVCDGGFIFLTAVYFIRRFKFGKEPKFLLVALSISLFPCLIDESMLLLNFGSYMSYALRFGFITAIVFYYIALKEANEFFKESEIPSSSLRLVSAGLMTAVAGGLVGGAYLLFDYILNGTFPEKTAFHSYFSSFAHSVGGLEGTAILFGGIVVYALIATLFIKFRLIRRKTAFILACVVALSSTVFNTFAMVKGDRQGGSYDNLIRYAKIYEKISEKFPEEKYSRLKSYDYYVSADSALVSRYYSGGLFSSMADENNLALSRLFKYKGNGTNSARTNGGGVLGDAVFGYKFVVYSNSDKENAERAYLKYTGIKVGSYNVYENDLAFPLATVINGKAPDFDGDNGGEKIERIIDYLSGGEVEVKYLDLTFTENEDGTLKIAYTVPSYSEYWHYNRFGEGSGISFRNSTSEIPPYSYYAYTETSGRRSVTLVKKGGALKREDVEPYYRVFAVTTENIRQIKERLKEKEVKFDLVRNGVEFPNKIVAEEGDRLVLSLADIDGYAVTVNGKKTEAERNGCFIVVPLEKGENEVKITYKSPYIKWIIAGVLAGVLLVATAYFMLKVKKRSYKAIEKPLGAFAIALSALIIGFFYLFPLGAFIWKILLTL